MSAAPTTESTDALLARIVRALQEYVQTSYIRTDLLSEAAVAAVEVRGRCTLRSGVPD